MDRLLFTFRVIVMEIEKQRKHVIAITSIGTTNGKVFRVPEELQPIARHLALKETKEYEGIKHTLRNKNEKRSIWVPLTKELRDTWMKWTI